MGAVQSCLTSAIRHILSSDPPLQELASEPEVPQFSWDKRDEKDLSKFILENVTEGQEVGRKPGEIDGEQFMIRNCSDCSIYLLDHMNCITVDDCKNCKIFIGPVKGSVFLRDCSGCTVVTACGQFRTRDCRYITVFMSCATQPIVEATTKAKFACFQYFYPELSAQLTKAELSPFNNLWWNLHDFTPVQGERNWSLLGECYKVHDYLSPPSKDEGLKCIQISTDSKDSCIPLTSGSRPRDSGEETLVLFFVAADENKDKGKKSELRAQIVLTGVSKASQEIDLVKAISVKLQASDSDRIFQSKEYRDCCERGIVIALQFRGPSCLSLLQRISAEVETASQGNCIGGLIRAAKDSTTAQMQAQAMFNFADMQMGI